MAGEHASLVRKRHQALHHGRADDVGGAAADRVAEERVAGEAHAVHDERDAVVGVAGRRDRLDSEPSGLERARHHGDAEAARQLVLVRHVVGVAVRAQDVRRREALALDRSEQRLERRTGVDEDRDAARLVADHEGVRKPVGVHRALDDHGHRLRGRARLRETPRVTRGLAAILVALAVAAPASGAVRVVAPFPPERYAEQRRDRARRPGRGADRDPRGGPPHAPHRERSRAR